MLACGVAASGIFTTRPKTLTSQERFAFIKLDQAPLQAPVAIYWNEHAVPYIEAKNTPDLSFTVGVVHAHLRLEQMEVMRLISQGRLSEVGGPIATLKDLDHGLRMLNFKQSAERTWEVMNPTSQQWMTQFTAGINWYIQQLDVIPITHKLLKLPVTEYSITEVIALSRMISADLTWGVYIKYLRLAANPEWREAFDTSLKKLETDSASYSGDWSDGITPVIKHLSRSGSNSLVVSGKRTTSGAGMIASDPHVGLVLPNFWLLIGMHSPEYHAIGYMIPGVPIIGVGRNRDIAWGGTNMRGISTHLYDASQIPAEQITVRTETLKRRWYKDIDITIRETPFGPILTDLELLTPEKLPLSAALHWSGASGSDELEAFLSVARAKNWDEFKNAFRNYRVSAMNMLYTDKKGNIGMVGAYGQPALKEPEKTLDFLKSPNNPVQEHLSPLTQPTPYNPPEGFIASANNKPFETTRIPFSFGYANNDRFERLLRLMQGHSYVGLEDLMRFQQDVYSRQSWKIKNYFIKKLHPPVNREETSHYEYYKALKYWDARYRPDSEGALVFYVSMYYAWQRYIDLHIDNDLTRKEMISHENWKPLLLKWLKTMPLEDLRQLLIDSLAEAAPVIKKYRTWGNFTQQTQTTLFGMTPGVGKYFRYPHYPTNGGNDTLNKYGRLFSPKPALVFYGASARHISDMASLDENYFVMHGGQDSWIMNDNLADQTTLWRQGEYMHIPLSLEGIKKEFTTHVTRLDPNSE